MNEALQTVVTVVALIGFVMGAVGWSLVAWTYPDRRRGSDTNAAVSKYQAGLAFALTGGAVMLILIVLPQFRWWEAALAFLAWAVVLVGAALVTRTLREVDQ